MVPNLAPNWPRVGPGLNPNWPNTPSGAPMASSGAGLEPPGAVWGPLGPLGAVQAEIAFCDHQKEGRGELKKLTLRGPLGPAWGRLGPSGPLDPITPTGALWGRLGPAGAGWGRAKENQKRLFLI